MAGNIQATQTGAGWDVDGPMTTQALAQLDTSGNPTGQIVTPDGDVVGGAPGPRSIDDLAGRFAGRTPKRLFVCGTSWADGTGASNASTTSYRGLLNNRYNGTLSPINASRGGSSVEWGVQLNALTANAADPIGPGDIMFCEMGFNDYATGDGSPKHINYWKKVCLAMLAWWCVPQRKDSLCSKMSVYNHLNPTARVPSVQPGVTVSGGSIGFGTASAQYRMGVGTTTTFTGEGDMIYVIRWRSPSTTQNIQTVTVDGVSMDVNQTQGTYAITSFVPVLERYPVSPGQHTVTVSGDAFPSECMIFYRGQVPAQTVLIQDCHDVRLDARIDNSVTNSTGLGLTAPNAWWWDEGLLQRYRKAIRECVDVMAYDGWEIGIVEQGYNWDPEIHTANPGAGASAVYHPNDRGHYQLHLPPADAIDRILGRK